MLHHLYTLVDELRNWTRFARERGSDFAVIWQESGQEVLAEVHDESLGGLGVYLDDITGFDIGREVNLVYAGEFMRAYVRHVEPRDGEYVVGFECERGFAGMPE